MNPSAGPDDRPRPWERTGLWLAALLIMVVGGFVELRTAFLSTRMSDLGVYLRAGWAARQGGADLYTTADEHGWHYNYPPLLAILLIPLAEPPPGELGASAVPFPITVAGWFVLSIASLAWSVHVLAALLDPNARPWGRRWWALRLVPLAACAGCIGETLSRSQVNLFVLACLSGWLASSARGRSWRAGGFLSLAICLKLIPMLLVLVPLVRRDLRCLAGCALGLFVGLILIPAVWFGPAQTVRCYRALAEGVIAPGTGLEGNSARAGELTDVTGTISQSFLSLLHNGQYLHLDRHSRPPQASPFVRTAHRVLAAAMILFTLWAFRRCRPPRDDLLFGATMILTMLMASPVSEKHYFALVVPLVMALMAGNRGNGVYPRGGMLALVIVNGVATVLPYFPGMMILQEAGVIGYSALLLWATACAMALRQPTERVMTPTSAMAA